MTADAIEYWLNLLAGDADYTPELETLEEIATALWKFSGRETLADTSVNAWRVSELDLDAIQRWTRQYAAMPRLVEAAGNADQCEWDTVHADWQAVAHLIWTAGSLTDDDTWEEQFLVWLRMVAVLGPWVSLVDLSMRWHGRDMVWENLRLSVLAFTKRLEAEPDLQRQMRAQWREIR